MFLNYFLGSPELIKSLENYNVEFDDIKRVCYKVFNSEISALKKFMEIIKRIIDHFDDIEGVGVFSGGEIFQIFAIS